MSSVPDPASSVQNVFVFFYSGECRRQGIDRIIRDFDITENQTMTREAGIQTDAFGTALRKLEQWRRFTGAPSIFWPGLLEAMSLLSGARWSVLLRKTPAEKDWRRVADWRGGGARDAEIQEFSRGLDALGNAAEQQKHAVRYLNGATGSLVSNCGIALRLDHESASEMWVAAFYLGSCSQSEATTALKLLRLVQDTASFYNLQRSAQQSQLALSHFTSVLDLMALLDTQRRFMAVAMTLCNELASRHQCDRVSLGWLDGDYIRLQAISHTEKFERKMEAIKSLEQTMEESFDQDEIICWPAAEGDTCVVRDHEDYAESQKVKFLCSVPLRLGGEPQGVVTCERNSEPFLEEEQRLLTLCAEMAVRRLSELKRTDRWFGARVAIAAREQLSKVVGVRHTWPKVTAVAVAIALGVLFFGRMTYRVEAPFILRTDNVTVLAAPFEGFIEEVPVRIGDPVKPNDILLKLDTRDLLLQEAALAADVDRYAREAEKARAVRSLAAGSAAASSLADMRIAEALADQSRARLGLIRFRLKQSAITASFDGVVVEGDLRQRIGAPVKQGDVLFKVARTDQMYIECSVRENEVHDVGDVATGEIAFASQPKLKFPMRITRIEPVAETKDQENVFIVRCQFEGAVEGWCRPGMSGMAKINVGKRTFFWILTHRTIDFLRMFFWM